ncbi:SapC family protein [Paraglaciecola chathamensis]|uniref:Peptidase n=3 Tax=Paraglaciecola chathamensis TaxID=368405 RepID=A0A8H9M4K3_9ALTE|nr:MULTISPECIES: SapC family protein [Paraglaciecola]AEE22851.1 SapC family protein [Glaciecola sp. 4H-3-7+YE-5]MBN28176.1 SapC protein [Alteromonadaceae bacterium]GAC04737.1 SapC family protein [Paraglaciecola agarilytica NO2]GAC10125.1 SapC protein [Paraglaciecola chathamensis S18K6]GGZ64238.1 peptidase [Paraglaciecola oceanifecundans]
MAKPVLIDFEQHSKTLIKTGRGAEFGENVHFIPVIADEVRALALAYPLCFLKDNNTGQFGLNVLTGFEAGENLYLQGDQWRTHYVPIHLRRQPFLVGVTEEGAKPTSDNTVLTLDMDSARVNTEQGEGLFNEQGKPSDYLTQMIDLLGQLMSGNNRTEVFIETLLEHDLIEELQLSITLKDGQQKRFDGLYNINEANLGALSSDNLEAFHKKGYLQACYLIAASTGHIQTLVEWKKAAQ